MHCVVYKSLRKADTYLFVRADGDLESIPKPIRETLGNLAKIMDLDLSPERKLARADASEVMLALQSRGYYLQMPPTD